MNEEYLWNKTGSDPELEKLENALKAFRYQEIAPPELPAKIIPFETKKHRGFFRLSIAFAGFAAVLIVCFGVWVEFSGNKTEMAKDSPKIILPPVSENVAKEIPTEKPADLIVEKTEKPKKSVERKAVKVRKFVPQDIRQNKPIDRTVEIKKFDNLVAKNIEIKKPKLKLTKEEKYAYDQLMLALSVTSSKLKLVSDKIEGIEDENAVLENGR